MFRIEFSVRAKKFLKKSRDKRILDKISQLKENPVLYESKKIVNEEKIYRIRAGDYRILYKVNWDEKVILIIKIDKRSRIYKR